ncbi:MAG: transcriptional regulator [Nitrospirae bacterium]|nr:MAG: transcriptional regulator [Nitrospirota bacterium]
MFSLENEKRDEWITVKKEVLEFHAEFCKTFSNPKRLEILCHLKEGEMTVSGLINKLGIPKANVSQHLSVMRMTGILKTRRDGLNIWYSITNKEIVDACGLMQNALANLMEGVAVSSKKPLLPQ